MNQMSYVANLAHVDPESHVADPNH
ncbi:uncharacterized protein METZ01_LOCUS10643 [marine metagenome]|uniref:Uncharacterized protein n=1 Tax=marine metagenome TaxID=408172 RepID=A0A381NU44_9ZZZZ